MSNNYLEFYGHSDDCFCVKGMIKDEFHPSSDQDITILVKTDIAPSFLVTGRYNNNGIWCVYHHIKEEGDDLSEIDFDVHVEHQYSMGLTIGFPDGCNPKLSIYEHC